MPCVRTPHQIRTKALCKDSFLGFTGVMFVAEEECLDVVAPLGKVGATLDRAVLQRVATATFQAFLRCVADAVVHPAGAPAPGREGQGLSWCRPPAPEMP